MDIKRKFAKPGLNEAIETLVFDAEDLGYNFIELRHLTDCETQDVFMGLDEARINHRRKAGSRIATAVGVRIITDGVLTFYPDGRGRRWAYLLDTPKNRQWLAAQLVSPLVDVVDSGIKKEIYALAEEKGFPTERATTIDHSFDAYLNNGVADEVVEMSNEIEDLKKQLAEAKKKAKPLSGKTIKKPATEK